jgi:hypothetical protein
MMTDQQMAQEVLYAYMDVEKDLSQPKILIHTLKKLRELMTGSTLNWEDEQGMMYEFGWTDCLKQIDAVCDELENL